MRCAGSGRAAARTRERLADAFWGCLEDSRLDAVSVGEVIEAAGVSRGTFYYHFAEKDELVRWALSRELLDADRAGTPLVDLMMGREPASGRRSEAEASVQRLCLLVDRGGMDVVYDAMVGHALDFWRAVLSPAGGELPDKVVASVEYSVGGLVGMLFRARVAPDADRRQSMAFLREGHLRLLAGLCRELGLRPAELRERAEALREGRCPGAA